MKRTKWLILALAVVYGLLGLFVWGLLVFVKEGLMEEEPTLFIVRAADDEVVQSLPSENTVVAAAFSPDGRLLVTGSSDGAVNLRRVSDWKVLRTFREQPQHWWGPLGFSPDGEYILVPVRLGTISLIATRSGIEVFRFRRVLGPPPVFSPDGKVLAINIVDDKAKVRDGTISLLRTSDGKPVRALFFRGAVARMAFSPDGKFFAASCYLSVKVWRMTDGKRIGTYNAYTYDHTFAFSPRGHKIAITEGGLVVRDTADLSRAQKLPGFPVQPTSQSLRFSPNGRFLVCTSLYTTRLWRLSDGRLLRRWYGRYTSSASPFAFLPDGDLLLMEEGRNRSQFDRVRVPEGGLVYRGEFNHRFLAVSPKGDLIAAGQPDWGD